LKALETLVNIGKELDQVFACELECDTVVNGIAVFVSTLLQYHAGIYLSPGLDHAY
jgi:hypothetical protein